MTDTRNFTRIPHTLAGTWLEGSHGWTNSYRVVDRAADLRAGRPGPCTQLILLHVQPPGKK